MHDNTQPSFHSELCRKFKLNLKENYGKKFIELIYGAYRFSPVALYLGCPSENGEKTHYLKLCHASFDFGSNPKDLLAAHQGTTYQVLQSLPRKTEAAKIQATYPDLAPAIQQEMETHPESFQNLTAPF